MADGQFAIMKLVCSLRSLQQLQFSVTEKLRVLVVVEGHLRQLRSEPAGCRERHLSGQVTQLRVAQARWVPLYKREDVVEC